MSMSTPILEEILLVDDNSFVNYFNKSILMEMGIVKNVHIASDGFDALNYLKECKIKDTCPELILFEAAMPMVDGPEFIKWVNMLQLLNGSSTKIIALTHGGNESILSELKEMGIDGIIYKPLEKNRFLSMLKELYQTASISS